MASHSFLLVFSGFHWCGFALFASPFFFSLCPANLWCFSSAGPSLLGFLFPYQLVSFWCVVRMWMNSFYFQLGLIVNSIWTVNLKTDALITLPLLIANSNRFSSHCGSPGLIRVPIVFSAVIASVYGLPLINLISYLLASLLCTLFFVRGSISLFQCRILGRNREAASHLSPSMIYSPPLVWPTITAFQKAHFIIRRPNVSVDSTAKPKPCYFISAPGPLC